MKRTALGSWQRMFTKTFGLACLSSIFQRLYRSLACLIVVLLIGAFPLRASTGARFYLANNFGNAVFPSFEISTATMQPALRNRLHLHSFILFADVPDGSRLDVTFKSTKFLRLSHTLRSYPKGGRYFFVPLMDWDFDALYAAVEPVPDVFTISVSMNGVPIWQYAATLQIRSINDCVYGFQEPMPPHRNVDAKILFAAYVDENDPVIDEILHEVIRRGYIRQFVGYQRGWDGAQRQMAGVWGVLQGMGVTYSSITTASGFSGNVGSQHVRLANDSLQNAEANCVDGSVLMAAIFRKIGLHSFLVLKPGHCFLAVQRTMQGSDLTGVETTMIGSRASFEKACVTGSEELLDVQRHIASKKPQYEIVDLQRARQLGIQPLRQIHDVKIADLIKLREADPESRN